MSNDPILQAAVERRRELEKEMADLDVFIEMHQRLTSRLAVKSSQLAGTGHASAREQVFASALPSSTSEILDTVEKVLKDRGGPVQLADLYTELRARGIVIPGKDPRNNLSAKLYGSNKFHTTRGVGWWFASDLGKDNGPADEGRADIGSGVKAPGMSAGGAR